MSNVTCHKHRAQDSPSFFNQNGEAVFQPYHVGWLLCGVFAVISTGVSFWLIDKHLQWYTNKKEQRYIVRLLLLVPIYAIISFASFLFWNNSTPLILVRDAYEAIVLAAFFYLLLNYLSPDPEEQKRIFRKAGISKENDSMRWQRGEKLQKWMWPLGFVKSKPQDGLYFLQLMKWAILQYCVIRPIATLVAVILDYRGLYCESSWSPRWGHIWIVVIISVSVTVAMYCLLQLYMPVAKQLKSHSPILKLFSVKAVVFLTFWQATFLSLLSMAGVVKDTKYMTAEDINIGVGALLQTFEMMVFAFVHVKAFTYKPYVPFYNRHSKDAPPERTPRLRSLGHALDFRETFREIWIGCIYLSDRLRGREPKPDFGARRAAHYEEAFGRSRPPQNHPGRAGKKAAIQGKPSPQQRPTDAMDISINQEVQVEVGGERQWLGVGDDYGYGLGYFRRERSEGLGVQIEKELQQIGYSMDSTQSVSDVAAPVHKPPSEHPRGKGQRSWWRNVYDRISQSGHEEDSGEAALTPSMPRRLQSRSRSRRQSEVQRSLLGNEPDVNETTRPASLKPADHFVPALRYTPGSDSGGNRDSDVLAPLSVYRERRRSYRPRRQRGDSSSALLPQSPQRPNSRPRSGSEAYTEEMGMAHGGGLDDFLVVPPSNYNRSDSLLNRIFPPSEAGSLNDLTRETDSAYSLSVDDHRFFPHIPVPSGSNVSNQSSSADLRPGLFSIGTMGDKRLQVQQNVVHPSRSANAMHAPWTADVITSQTNLNEPPPLPEKDYYPPTSPKRSHRREHAGYRPMEMDYSSIPSLPDSAHFVPPLPPVPRPARGGNVLQHPPDSPSTDSFSSFSDRNSFSIPEPRAPPTSHKKAIHKLPVTVDIKESRLRPSVPSGQRIPTSNRRRSQPTTHQSSPDTSRSSRRGHDDSSRLQVSSATTTTDDSNQRRLSVDSARLSDLSTSTFYTAISQPPDATHRRR
ncbi:DUF300-domain-containing protein [Coprinopsis marcescibilis]|uniref:DUF300-domain-containing protein n=1 Tax=Coprinopsis marcescibilis TaxID=230819 RepID=A0A5C3KUZ2_COPMA|nr:DUF300-domain-containing protein [Coprinopsis marcescibilis]